MGLILFDTRDENLKRLCKNLENAIINADKFSTSMLVTRLKRLGYQVEVISNGSGYKLKDGSTRALEVKKVL